MNLLIHNPCNSHTRYYRNYNLFWDQFTDYLKIKHNVIEDRFFEDAHTQRYPIKLISSNADLLLMECEYIVEDMDSGNFAVLSVSDDLSHATLDEKHNPNLKLVLISQFIRSKITSHTYEESYKYKPWIYFPSSIDDLKFFYQKKQSITDSIPKLFFRGTSLQDRSILQFINKDLLTGPQIIGSPPIYFNDLLKHRVGLSVGGRGELCYRDIEYMAIGVPMLRFEYQIELAVPLIPNIHYISIPLPEDLPKHNDIMCDRLGLEHHAKMLEEKFLEVVNDHDFLNYIATNARQYYENYLSPENRLTLTYNLLKTSGLIKS